MTKTALFILIIILVAAMSGCTTKMSSYTHENDTSERMILYADQRYEVIQENGFVGTWSIHGGALRMYYDGALLHVLEPAGNDYLDPDGDRWIRE